MYRNYNIRKPSIKPMNSILCQYVASFMYVMRPLHPLKFFISVELGILIMQHIYQSLLKVAIDWSIIHIMHVSDEAIRKFCI